MLHAGQQILSAQSKCRELYTILGIEISSNRKVDDEQFGILPQEVVTLGGDD